MSDHILGALSNAGIEATPRPAIVTTPDGDIFGVSVAGGDAIAAWQVCRELFQKTSLWPVVAGEEEELEYLEEGIEFNTADDPAPLEELRRIDAEEWFRKRVEDDPEFYSQPERGPWPEGVPPTDGYTIPIDLLSGNFLGSVNVLFPKVLASYLVPMHLQYGGWNECPMPAEHAAIHRYWNEHYGAEIVGLTHDVIECRIDRPPTSREAAMMLATQQYLYCADIVDQGTETIENLAATLLNGKSWYFWWD